MCGYVSASGKGANTKFHLLFCNFVAVNFFKQRVNINKKLCKRVAIVKFENVLFIKVFYKLIYTPDTPNITLYF